MAWHFVRTTLRDGRPIPADGEWLEHDGRLSLCNSGLHASTDAFDALQSAPGNTLCRVECGGEMQIGDDKLVCKRRRILERRDAEKMLRAFARAQVLSVLHLWDAPAVVREYLETGDESKRPAARSYARDAARDSAREKFNKTVARLFES